jgi:hypothetical protein
MEQAEKHKVVTFKVDDEELETTKKKLTVREILVLAEEDPETHFLQLVKHGKPGTEYKNLDEELPLHDGIEFVTVFTGPTHVS